MDLEALSCGGTKIALSVFGAQVVKEAIEVGRKLTGRLFETEHELVVFGATSFTIVLLV